MENESHVLNRPFEANDNEPYIFISYKHSDWRAVYPVIKRFNDAGFNVWYDAGLSRGRSYDIEIANHIKNAALFITFITETVIERACDDKDYLVLELSAANHLRKDTLPIFLDPIKLDGYYLIHYAGKKSIMRHQYGDSEDLFIEDCIRALKYDFGIQPVKREEPLQIDEDADSNPSPAYGGEDSYIFASYASNDADEVLAEIEKFQNLGFHIWYPHGESVSDEQTAEALINSSLLAVFISKNAALSRDVEDEVNLALRRNIPIVEIDLEKAELKPSLELRLSSQHQIQKYSMGEEEYVDKFMSVFKNLGME